MGSRCTKKASGTSKHGEFVYTLAKIYPTLGSRYVCCMGSGWPFDLDRDLSRSENGGFWKLLEFQHSLGTLPQLGRAQNRRRPSKYGTQASDRAETHLPTTPVKGFARPVVVCISGRHIPRARCCQNKTKKKGPRLLLQLLSRCLRAAARCSVPEESN